MHNTFKYATVSEAINILRQEGFNKDFNIIENRIRADSATHLIDDFEIMDVYRYEGDSDPADEAIVYALVSPAGVKGILVTGYGDHSDGISMQLLAKLHY